MRILDKLIFEPGCFYILDRGHVDYSRLFALHQSQAFFVIRAKSNLRFYRIISHPVDRSTDVRSDQDVAVTGFYSHDRFPERLRRIRFYDRDNDRYLVFLTNYFALPALPIAQLYKLRWQIELFFRWIK